MYVPRTAGRRAGYTLAEMMVAAAVAILIMVILTGAFQSGMDTFRNMRVQGNLMERARMARQILADDLSSPHFARLDNGDSEAGSSAKDYLSGQDLTRADNEWKPPEVGFFRIWQGPDPDWTLGVPTLPCVPEGTDAEKQLFARAKTHALHFTVRRRGAGPEHILRTWDMVRPVENLTGSISPTAQFPRDFIDPIDYRDGATAGLFASQWSEVAYFLVPQGTSASFVTANGTVVSTPLFSLHRRQMLLLPPAIGPYQRNTEQSQMVATDPVAGTAYWPMNGSQTTYNPEISFRKQFKDQVSPATFRYFFNRAGNVETQMGYPPYPPPPAAPPVYGSVTQPRFRFGMNSAHEIFQPTPVAPQQSVDMALLAGLPTGVTGDPVNLNNLLGGDMRKPYPRMEDDFVKYIQNPQSEREKIGNDLLLSDVLSFEVKAYWEVAQGQQSVPTPGPSATYTIGGQQVYNTDYPFDYLPVSTTNQVLAGLGARVFDTWSKEGPYGHQETTLVNGQLVQQQPNWQRTDNAANPLVTATRLPLRVRVRAIMIRLRLWDPKAEKVRQITLMQDV